MKRNIIVLAILAFFSACTDFQDINTDVYGVTDEEYKQGGLAYGAPFMKMQQLVIPIGSPDKTTGPGNDLQNTDLISSGNYIGYFGNNNNWGFNTEANWNFNEGRMGYAQKNFYSNLFREWQEINVLAKDSKDPYDQQVFALANIVKIAGWLRATDVFGPIVYSNAGKGDIAPKLDSQEEVYKHMLADLSKSVETLKDVQNKLLKDYDVIYDGDAKKWVKFANSLMLRMAVRSHFKDHALAQEYIDKALNPANGGVITSPDEEAKIGSSAKLPLLNSMIASVEEYGETRMGTTIWSYLVGYKDPRLEVYFTPARGEYNGIAPENKLPKTDYAITAAAKPKVQANSPLYWYRASETYFLKAEAALYGLISEDAQALYEQGIKTSFQENNISSGVEKYLASNSKPKNLTTRDYKFGTWTDYYSFNLANGNTSPNWNDTWDNIDETEQHLQKILTQKYLALYPNAVEAWTEYRRTGYPYIMKPFDQTAPGRIGCHNCYAPERFSYAPTEYTSNPSMREVPALLGGDDQGSTKLWWVRNNRPKQQN
ncbi:SusD/RagB family nutrient-binding outer membrane lipoprotein [Ornithobacterium rhinotracheale]|uniref:SusD/RagB family nutrient-binding outer membrane lipoprotein n=1 Tax=Ornithobacterium rhinotracheale TaxID=28251 RepID=UPI003FA498FC